LALWLFGFSQEEKETFFALKSHYQSKMKKISGQGDNAYKLFVAMAQ
jgi:hypothetical protein